MADLTWDERVALAHEVSQLLDEETTDRFLDLLEARLRALADDKLPGWAKAMTRLPFVPHPATFVRNQLDKYAPEAIRDPIVEAIKGE